jgi:hypothetical protein
VTASAADQPDDKPKGIARASQNVLESVVRLGVDGFGPFKSARESAEEALKGRSSEQAIKALIRNHCLVAGSQGFVTSLGGFITMPVTLPANVGAGFLVQSHLAAAIGHIHGHDLHSEEVQTAILLCLLGNTGTEIVKQAGVVAGTKYSLTLLKRLPVSVIYAINKKAGYALLAKFGTKRAAITLAKGIPLVGGGIGGTVDAVATKAVGTFANNFFKS